jgi:biotin transporter BioY
VQIKRKIAGARKSLTMKFNALMLVAGGVFGNMVESLNGLIALARLLDLDTAKAGLSQMQSFLDPEVFKWIGGTLAVVGLINMMLRLKTNKSIEELAPVSLEKPTPKTPAE